MSGRKIIIVLFAFIVFSGGLYWHKPLVEAAVQLLRVSQGVGRMRLAPKNGLVGHWTFDDCDNCTSVADKSGNGNTGTVTDTGVSGARNRVSGKINNAMSFAGANEYVSTPTNQIPSGNSHITISYWQYQRSNTAQMATVSLEGPTGYTFTIVPIVLGGNYYIWTNSIDASFIVTPAQHPPLNQWVHVAINYDGTKINYYKDGVFQASYVTSVNTGDLTVNYIGRRVRVATGDYNGIIDDVRIYNRALSADEIMRLYEEGGNRMVVNANQNNIMSGGLVGMWSFNGPDMDWSQSSAEARDVSENGNHGNVTNFGSEAVRPGIIGQALRFDGVDDKIVSAANIPITGDAAATISAWVKFADLTSGTRVIASFGQSESAGAGMSLFQGLNGSGSISVEFYGLSSCRTGAGTVSTGIWYHIVGTKLPGSIGVSTTKLYLNGVAQPLTCNTSITPNILSGPFIIGGDDAGYISNAALIDDVRVYNRALNAAEVQELYLSSARL